MLQVKNLLCKWRKVFCFVLLATPLFAAFEFQGIGWPAAGANIKVVGNAQLDRLLVNPALLGDEDQSVLFNLQYSRPFAGLDLQAGAIHAKFSVLGNPLITGLMYMGDEYYSEIHLTAGARKIVTPGFRAGISLNYFNLGIVGFELQQAMTLSMSTSVKIADDVQLGSGLQHITQVGESLSIPQQFLFGVEYSGAPLHLLVSLEKEAALPLELCVAIVSPPSRKWQIAFGYRNLSQVFSAGWRFKYEKFGAHYTWLIHPHLPASHGFGLEWSFQ